MLRGFFTGETAAADALILVYSNVLEVEKKSRHFKRLQHAWRIAISNKGFMGLYHLSPPPPTPNAEHTQQREENKEIGNATAISLPPVKKCLSQMLAS